MKYIQGLSGLRGLAALTVLISHTANEGLLPSQLGMGFGQVGVMLFFILSGFLMAHLYLGRPLNRQSLASYVAARAGRVLPLFYGLLAASAVLTLLLPDEVAFPYRVTSLPRFAMALGLFRADSVFWTIPVEIQFYAIFVGLWYLRSSGRSLAVQGTFAFLTMSPSILLFFAIGSVPTIVSSYCFAFFVGVVTAVKYEAILGWFADKRWVSAASILCFVVVALNLPELRNEYGLAFGSSVWARTWGDPLTVLSVYGAFLFTIVDPPALGFLKNRALTFLGDISYGVYLIHLPIVYWISRHTDLPTALKLVAIVGLTVGAAQLSLVFFERPVGAIVRRSAEAALRGRQATPGA